MQDNAQNAQAQPSADPGFEVVEGVDPATIRLKRVYEAQVEKKVMKESAHIIWAYGLIWVLFALYAGYLAKKMLSLRSDLQDLERGIGSGKP